MGDNNRVVKLVNVDADILASLNLANTIRGSSSKCNSICKCDIYVYIVPIFNVIYVLLQLHPEL